MAQVIKIEDYISRYEIDPYRYTNQFIRYKKLQWEELKNKSESDHLEQMKKQFLDKIFQNQIIWASSTVRSQSFVDEKYYSDSTLKYFAQRFPDQYLFMYYPVFSIKKAPMQAEIIILCPTEILCISFLDGEKDEVIIATDDHFWIQRGTKGEQKILSPITGLKRTEGIIKSSIKDLHIEMPIKKLLIYSDGYIHAPDLPLDYKIVDKREYEEWFYRMRQNPSPIKHNQLKIAKTLLSNCLSTSYDRFDF